jgi:hypothetical protein
LICFHLYLLGPNGFSISAYHRQAKGEEGATNPKMESSNKTLELSR